MSAEVKNKVSVSKLFTQQVVINFVVIALLVGLGALLVFKVYVEDYSQYTALGFIAAVYFSFIVFLPAGTLFASRAEFAKGKVAVAESEKTGATEPIPNPLAATAPLGVLLAAASTAVASAVVFGLGWTPSPIITTLIAMLGLLLLMGVGVGVVVAGLAHVFGVQLLTFTASMALKFVVVFLAVCVACWLGVGWAGKKFNDAVKMAA